MEDGQRFFLLSFFAAHPRAHWSGFGGIGYLILLFSYRRQILMVLWDNLAVARSTLVHSLFMGPLPDNVCRLVFLPCGHM